jgi:hypothetical protein
MKNQIKSMILLSLVVILSSFASAKNEVKKETVPPTANFGQLKAAFMGPTQKGFLLTDKKYYKQNLRTDRLEKSGTIASAFDGMTNNVDAALLFNNGKAYFFKGSTYYRYNFVTRKSESPRTIGVHGWKGVPKNIDAAVVHSNGHVYFFKGDTYYRYNISKKKVDNKALISKYWKGVPNNVDAALRHVNGKTYFFKGNTYYRYDPSDNKVDKEATIGETGWKGLSFAKKLENATPSSKNNIRLKVTLTRIKSIQARDSDNIADFILEQKVNYRTKEIQKLAIEKNIKVGANIINTEDGYYRDKDESSSIFNARRTHVREGDENHFINNSLVYEITPQEIKDKRADFNFYTNLAEIDGDNWLFENIMKLFAQDDVKKIARKHLIDVNIYHVLEYLQNPSSSKYGGNYFKDSRGGKMHEYGAFGDVMWFKKGSNNSLIGHLEFGANNKETYVRLYYRFELVP